MIISHFRRAIAPILAAFFIAPPAVSAAEPSGAFVVFSDIHFDPFDPPGLAGELVGADPRDWNAIFAKIETQKAAQYGTDTNYALFRSSLAALSRVGANADFVIVPGDLLSHEFRKTAAAALGLDGAADEISRLTEKTTIFVAEELRRALPGKHLLLALGNNDSACGDYKLKPSGSYLAATVDIVRDLAGAGNLEPDFEETYRTGGYYALRHPTVPNTVILVLSDTLWSAKYENACAAGGGVDGAEAMLAWLERRLADAKAEGEQVWLVRHIPMGIDAFATLNNEAKTCAEKIVPLLREPYWTRLPELMHDFANPILVSLAGHIHRDSYRLVTDVQGTVIDVDKIVPAISPIYDQNPGFQVFTYDVETGLPTDFDTWFLSDLPNVTLEAPGTWKREYRFTRAYDLQEYSAAGVSRLWQEIAAPGPRRDAFSRYYPVSYGRLTAEELPAYICAMRFPRADDFAKCYCDS